MRAKLATPLLDYYLSDGFSKYKDYLEEVSKNSSSENSSYADFAKNQENDFFGNNKYLKELEANLPL